MPNKKLTVQDPWHFSRRTLADQILNMFESGLSNALVFFAPRRMGKTEFLKKDIAPLAEQKKWIIFYFSFLDGDQNIDQKFMRALLKFADNLSLKNKMKGITRQLGKVSAQAMGIKGELEFQPASSSDLNDILEYLSEENFVLLLMDEVQALAKNITNTHFIATLRTALDIHKDKVKVIFTGSSQTGLRKMFSQASAPFFHFGQNLPFPELGRAFTDHLTQIFFTVTTRKLDPNALWEAFEKMEKVPQLARSLVERLALNPDLTLDLACDQLLADVYAGRTYVEIWEGSSLLSRLLLKEISIGIDSIFSVATRKHLAKSLGTEEVTVSSLQSSLRHLERKGLIGRMPDKNGEYYIDDPNFKNWLSHRDEVE